MTSPRRSSWPFWDSPLHKWKGGCENTGPQALLFLTVISPFTGTMKKQQQWIPASLIEISGVHDAVGQGVSLMHKHFTLINIQVPGRC